MSVETGADPSQWLPIGPVNPASAWANPDGVLLLEFRLGLSSLPYLAHHGFHDMVVLPGAFYIALARRVHRERFHRDALSLRHIIFERPIILTDAEVALTVRVEQRENGRVFYQFFEVASDDVRQAPGQRPCAHLEIDDDSVAFENASYSFDADHFSEREPATEFYANLRRNGNQYGPSFQTLADVSLAVGDVLGRLAETAREDGESLTTPLLDTASQLLSAFAVSRGKTFILKAIDHIAIGSLAGTKPCSARATRTSSAENNDDTLVGSVAVMDADGTCLWELSGVTLAFIDRPTASASSPSRKTQLCVASTFTAEPLKDSLQFWGKHFGSEVAVDFAPYNQVFQQLLDPASAFHRNRDGINLLVLNLEDWQRENRHSLTRVDANRAAKCFGTRPRVALPNGLEIVHLNRYETDYVYQEIFEDQSYLRHGIQLTDGDTVIDIGANIGLFSLFVLNRCANANLYAYEPSPRVFNLLQANLAAYGDPARVHAFHCGVAERTGTASFTFYEHSSVFSSFHPDEREDRAAVEAVVRNVLQHELSEGGVQDADVEDLTTHRLRAETIECPLTSVSEIIRANGLTRIHLLKIDAEKSELGILRGIGEEHWPLIEQIVMEIHDRTRAAVKAIEDELTRRGFRCAVVEEKLLEDSGLFNIYATRRASVAATPNELTQKVDEFCDALDTFAASTSPPLILVIAPQPSTDAASAAAEDRLLTRASRHSQVCAIRSQSILDRYPVREFHDPHSRQLGHIPFTPEGYAAIGTALFRAVFQLGAPRIKVLALDCDNTLWQGVCGEDGAAGVQITPAFRRLQEFVVEQTRAGVLVALCSKNQEADVWAVFDQRADMVLRREHLAAWRLDWNSKAENLRALAAQLNLGLDSFVFLDDNPLECAAVRAACPEVTVLQLPAKSEKIPAFLNSLWIFDAAPATSEDRTRSEWYRTNLEREEQRAAAPTLRDFLAGLQLRIDVREATNDQLARVAQLTLRTNQFNLTTIRRSENEIRDLLASGARCLVTSVSDRFGDYGLVGAILYTAAADRLIVDTLLLSCRALGKGVEHRMVAELATRALREGKSTVEFHYCPTERNEPARVFLARLAGVPVESEFTCELSAADLAHLRYEPEERPTVSPAPKAGASSNRTGFGFANVSAAMQKLGEEFSSISAVIAAIEASQAGSVAAIEPELNSDASALEKSLATIWKKALGRAQIGMNENFFDAGGTSLKAVIVVAAIRKELKKDASIISLFECPTIKLLAARLDEAEGAADAVSTAAAGAESRGRQRRHKIVKRKAA